MTSFPAMKTVTFPGTAILIAAAGFLHAGDRDPYIINAVFPNGVIIETADGCEWIDTPFSAPAQRQQILTGAVAALPAPVLTAREGNSASPPESANFVYSPRPSFGTSMAAGRVREAFSQQSTRELTARIPGGGSPRELPWEFVSNEIGMLLLWFGTKESDPESVAISNHIRAQHRIDVLLHRLFIRPWLKKDDGSR